MRFIRTSLTGSIHRSGRDGRSSVSFKDHLIKGHLIKGHLIKGHLNEVPLGVFKALNDNGIIYSPQF
mgnify:CR=1 FL=1